MKGKWWIPAAVIVLCAVLLCIYPVRLRLAPRWMVSRALGSALEQLENRFEDSPVHLLTQAIDPQSRQKAHVQLETEQAVLGLVRYDMQLCTQLRPCRILAEGNVVAGGKVLDLSVYLDGDFAALSSRSLVEGSYYGITYDTFSENIHSRQLLSALIGEKTISRWEQSVSDLDEAMSREWKLPEFRTEDIVSALYGVMALKPQVNRVETPPNAHAVTFRASVQEIVQAAEPYRDEIPPELRNLLDALNQDPAAVIRVEFLLHKGNLVQIQGELDSSGAYAQVCVVLGDDPENEPLTVEVITKAGEDDSGISLEIETASDEETYRERLRLTQTRNTVRSTISLDYGFDLSTGEMDLTILRDGEEAQLRMNLAGEKDTLTIISQDVTPLLNLFLKKPLESPAICTMTLSPGSEVDVPQYRNLDQWSLEDLLALLAGFGGLLGIKLQ